MSGNLRHGHARRETESPAYISWRAMIYRCNGKNGQNYKYYGGRGIRVCKIWLDFENFYADMGPPPKGTTLDRINNDGDYKPSNCRWATKAQQSQNSRQVRKLTAVGVTMSITEWATAFDIPLHTFYARLSRGESVLSAGMPIFRGKPLTEQQDTFQETTA